MLRHLNTQKSSGFSTVTQFCRNSCTEDEIPGGAFWNICWEILEGKTLSPTDNDKSKILAFVHQQWKVYIANKTPPVQLPL
jgi:hypothetical protein